MSRSTSRRRASVLIAGAALLGGGALAGGLACTLPGDSSAPGAVPDGGIPAVAGGPAPFPADEAPFDRTGRLPLVLDHLTFLEGQYGLFPGRGVALLPVAPWVMDPDHRSPVQQWSVAVDGGIPLSLLAQAEPDGVLDATRSRVTLDGAVVEGLGAYALRGIAALSDGVGREFAVLHLVLPPLAPGQHTLEVQTPAPAGKPGAGGVRRQTYSLTVRPTAALGPLLLQAPSGEAFALEGARRRLVPDDATLAALGFVPATLSAAGAPALARVAPGPALPALKDGSTVRAGPGGDVFRLTGGRREWLPDAPPDGPWPWSPRVAQVEPAVLQTVPPILRDGMLIRGSVPDLFHVDRGALRKVPPEGGEPWLRDRRLDSRRALYVPDRTIATLPQNSPHWRQPGGVAFDRVLPSRTLGRPMPYRVYLPPDYGTPGATGKRYPVLYLLHGNGGRYDEWSGYGLEEVANELLATGGFGHVIVVMPQGGRSYWVNQVGGLPWADYVVRDVVPHVDATYRTQARREARAVGGLSMGGHGALQLTLNFPAVFGIAGAHSPSVPTRDDAPAYFGGNAGFVQRDPFALVRVGPAPERPPQLWIDVGEADRWRRDAEAVHRALDERGWAHEWRLFPGSHDGSYWGDHLWEYLPFYAQAFARNGALP